MNQVNSENTQSLPLGESDQRIHSALQAIYIDLFEKLVEQDNSDPTRVLRLIVLNLQNMGFLTAEDAIVILSKIDFLNQQNLKDQK